MKPSPELAALFEPVLEWLDRGGDEQMGFNMAFHFDEKDATDFAGDSCGTSACIVGALSVLNPELEVDISHECPNLYSIAFRRAISIPDTLVYKFDMDREDANRLFYINMGATSVEAAATVRHWIETGEVVWK